MTALPVYSKRKSPPLSIYVWVCPCCRSWQRWQGLCDGLCGCKVKRRNYVLAPHEVGQS